METKVVEDIFIKKYQPSDEQRPKNWLPKVIFFTFFTLYLEDIVVSQIVLNKSEQSLEYNWMPEISTTQTLEE